MENDDQAKLDQDTAETRLRELTAIVKAGERAAADVRELIKFLRQEDPKRYTQARLAELAEMTQQAVSALVDPKRHKWHFKGPVASHDFTITGPTIKEAVLAHLDRFRVGGEIVDVHAELHPEIAGYYNIRVDVEYKSQRGNQIATHYAASDTRRAEMTQRAQAMSPAVRHNARQS